LSTTTPRRRPARTKILAAAEELFYTRGTAVTGIDTVTEHAKVARKSLYNNFASKDELIAAWLEQRHADWLAFYVARRDTVTATTTGATTADTDGSTAHPALAVFDAYLDHAASSGPDFRGCGLLNTAAEYPADSPVRDVVRRHKEEVEQLLAEDAPEDAELLSYLLEGAVTRAGLDGTPDRLHRARDMASTILAARQNDTCRNDAPRADR
jgi:AcrR family transcriptional regulator